MSAEGRVLESLGIDPNTIEKGSVTLEPFAGGIWMLRAVLVRPVTTEEAIAAVNASEPPDPASPESRPALRRVE